MSKNKAKEAVTNESSLTQFKSFNVLKHPLNRFCGIFVIFVGDKAYFVKTVNPLALAIDKQYKLLTNKKHPSKELQDTFLKSTKAMWFIPLILLPIRFGEDANSYLDVIYCLFYELLQSINNKHVLANKVLRQVDKTVLNCIANKRPLQYKELQEAITVINIILKLGPPFRFKSINNYFKRQEDKGGINIFYMQPHKIKTKPFKLIKDDFTLELIKNTS